MSRPVILRPEAEEDMAAARDWYEQQRAGLGDEFIDEADRLFARLAATPEMHQVVLKDVRRGKLRRFPYVVYYRVRAKRVEVLAVMHGRRDPSAWHDRS